MLSWTGNKEISWKRTRKGKQGQCQVTQVIRICVQEEEKKIENVPEILLGEDYKPYELLLMRNEY